MNRESGFYWVKYKKEWVIGYFNVYNKAERQFWWTLPSDWGVDELYDDDFIEIDENRIIK